MKRTTILLAVILSLCIVEGRAQNNNDFKGFEFEAAAGLIFAGADGHYDYDGPGLQLMLEARHNLRDSNFDLAWQLSMGAFFRESSSATIKINNKSTLMTFTDYNLRKHRNITPFVGLGVGLAFVDYGYEAKGVDGHIQDYTSYDRHAVLTPRIGVEFYNRLRLTAEYRVMNKSYSHFGLNVGVVFGGGRK